MAQTGNVEEMGIDKAVRTKENGVPSGGRIYRITGGRAGQTPNSQHLRVVHGHFLPADVNGELFGAFTDDLGSSFHPVGQHIAYPFPVGQFCCHGHNCTMITPSKVDAVRIFVGQNSVFK